MSVVGFYNRRRKGTEKSWQMATVCFYMAGAENQIEAFPAYYPTILEYFSSYQTPSWLVISHNKDTLEVS